MLEFALILLLVFSIAAIQTRYLRHAIIYLGMFSLSISFVYLLYHAPDVAIAEAIVGTTISTILFIIALQKYKIFTIYYHVQPNENRSRGVFSKNKIMLLKTLEKFCSKSELEAQIIYSSRSLDFILEKHKYALIVEENDDCVWIYGHEKNYKLEELEAFLRKEIAHKVNYKVIARKELIE